jgi:Domain of unknown function (DUF4365)
MTPNDIKEHLSRNQFKTIANRCGYKCERPGDGDNGVDFHVDEVITVEYPHGLRVIDTGKSLQFQLKATTENGIVISNGFVKFDLEATTYNDLIYRLQGSYPLTLILAVLPEVDSDWVVCKQDRIEQHTKLYWYRPEELDAPTENQSTKRINIPLTNLVDLQFLPKKFKEVFE